MSYRLTPEILSFQSIPLFIFFFTVPLKRFPIKNVEDIVAFLGIKVFNSDNSIYVFLQ